MRPYNDSAHKLRALTYQLQATLGHLECLNALISNPSTAHASFMRLIYPRSALER